MKNVNVDINKNSSETNTSVLRRFTKRVKSSGLVQHVRSLRYYSQTPNKTAVKKQSLRGLRNKLKNEELAKLGRLPANPRARK